VTRPRGVGSGDDSCAIHTPNKHEKLRLVTRLTQYHIFSTARSIILLRSNFMADRKINYCLMGNLLLTRPMRGFQSSEMSAGGCQKSLPVLN
jgi:hypothetical protein